MVCFSAMAEAKDVLVMGMHPFKPAVELHKIFKPIADHISQKVGKPVELQVARSNDDTADKVGKGQFDFSYMGSAVYIKAREENGVIPLGQTYNNGKAYFNGVIVIKKGSGIKSMRDLKGKSFAFGDPNSTLTHLVPVYMLLNADVRLADLKKYAFVGSHDNMAMGVLAGAFDAASIAPETAEKYKEKGLEVLLKTPDLPEHVFAANKDLDPATVAKIQEALTTMDPSLYKAIRPSLTGIKKFNDKDFDQLRSIFKKIEPELQQHGGSR